MNEHGSNDKELWEAQINALLDGELGPGDSEKLKAAATQDQQLARAIIEAYQLQQALEQVGIEQAPASLRRRLRNIPRRDRRVFFQPRWAMAFAAIPVLVAVLVLMQPGQRAVSPVEQAQIEPTPVGQPQVVQAPTGLTQLEQAQIEKTRQELQIAFAYIGLVSEKTSHRIESELGGEMSDAVAGSIFKTIQQQKIL